MGYAPGHAPPRPASAPGPPPRPAPAPAPALRLHTQFEYADDPARVVIDLSSSHVWDAWTVAALDASTTKCERKGTSVEIHGLDEHSTHMHDRLSGQLSGH